MDKEKTVSRDRKVKLKIVHKLIASVVAATMLVIAFGYYASRQSEQALRESIVRAAFDVADQTLAEMEHHFYDQVTHLQAYAKTPAVRDGVGESNRAFSALTDVQAHIDKINSEWTAVRSGEPTPFMQGLLEGTLSQEFKERVAFSQSRHESSPVAELFVTNRYGANVALSGRTTDYRQDDERWWQDAKANRHHVGDIEYDESADVYANSIAVRIDDDRGGFAGVLKAVLNSDRLHHLMDAIETRNQNPASRGRVLKLVNAAGKLLYSTGSFSVFEDVPDVFGTDRTHVVTTVDPSYGEVLCVRSVSRGHGDFEALGWTFIVEQPTSQAFAPVRQLKKEIIVFVIGACALTGMLGGSLLVSISKPILQLRQGTQVIASGDLHHRVAANRRDEIGMLARDFNRMTEALQETTVSRDDLAEEVAHREKAEETLKEKVEELERFNRLTIGRELRVIELKTEVNALLGALGRDGNTKPARSFPRPQALAIRPTWIVGSKG